MIQYLTVDVRCFQPNWVFEEHNLKYSTPSYRIYIDNDLLIERNWVWSGNQYISENLIVELEPGTSGHSLKLEPALLNPAQARFNIYNPTLNGRSLPLRWRDDFFLDIGFDT